MRAAIRVQRFGFVSARRASAKFFIASFFEASISARNCSSVTVRSLRPSMSEIFHVR
jgi:hypothetical protein